MNNSTELMTCVFMMSFGWGVAVMLICFWEKTKKILEHCTKALRLQKEILESNDSIQKKMVQYSEVIMECYKSSHEETGKIIKGLGDIVKAVEAEERKKNGEMQIMRSRDQMDQDAVREVNACGS